jgi:hypothetical protein
VRKLQALRRCPAWLLLIVPAVLVGLILGAVLPAQPRFSAPISEDAFRANSLAEFLEALDPELRERLPILDRTCKLSKLGVRQAPSLWAKLTALVSSSKAKDFTEILMVVDMTKLEQVAELEDVSARKAFLSEDRGSLVTLHHLSDGYFLRCWSLPLNPPLWQVIGIPIGIALFVLAAGWTLRGRHLGRKP